VDLFCHFCQCIESALEQGSFERERRPTKCKVICFCKGFFRLGKIVGNTQAGSSQYPVDLSRVQTGGALEMSNHCVPARRWPGGCNQGYGWGSVIPLPWPGAEKVILVRQGDEHLGQVLRLKGLGDIAVHAGDQTHFPVFTHGMGGHGDDWEMAAAQPIAELPKQLLGQIHLQRQPLFQSADDFGGGQAVHQWHLHIHKDKIEGLTTQNPQGVQAVGSSGHPMVLFQHHRGNITVDLVIVHHEDAQVLHLQPRMVVVDRRRISQFGRAGFEIKRQMKGAAPTGLAFHPHSPAHESGQQTADRQAQPGAAVLPGIGIIRLLKALEDCLQLVRRDADAGVGDAEMEAAYCLLRPLFHCRFDLNGDGPLGRELDRIAHQVKEDLVEAEIVADHRLRHSGSLDDFELEPLFHGRDVHGGDEGLEEPVDGERPVVDLQLAGFDLGKIEDVVEEAEQALGRLLHRPKKALLLRGITHIQRQVGHAENGVHRRADLVAHVGQKERFCSIGCFRPLLGFF